MNLKWKIIKALGGYTKGDLDEAVMKASEADTAQISKLLDTVVELRRSCTSLKGLASRWKSDMEAAETEFKLIRELLDKAAAAKEELEDSIVSIDLPIREAKDWGELYEQIIPYITYTTVDGVNVAHIEVVRVLEAADLLSADVDETGTTPPSPAGDTSPCTGEALECDAEGEL